MAETVEPDEIENIQLNSLAELDRLVAEQFNLPLRPYATEIRASLELVAWSLENSDAPHFEIFRVEDHALTGLPFVASFQPKPQAWGYGETAPLAICQAALFQYKRVQFILSPNS